MGRHFGEMAVPLTWSEDGRALRVAGTRVPLATVVRRFQAGETPEQIVLRFPSLALADVYSVVGYHLSHQSEIDGYVRDHDEASEIARHAYAARSDMADLRRRSQARRDAMNADAAAGR